MREPDLSSIAHAYALRVRAETSGITNADEALELLDEALTTYASCKDASCPEVGETLHAKARQLAALGRHAEALVQGRDALRVYQILLPDDDDRVLQCVSDLLDWYSHGNNWGMAEMLAEWILEVHESRADFDDVDIARDKIRLAGIRIQRGNTAEGFQLLKQTLCRAGMPSSTISCTAFHMLADEALFRDYHFGCQHLDLNRPGFCGDSCY